MKKVWLPFKPWSVRAMLEGRKTQTRRPMKEQPPPPILVPPAHKGDILCVREALVKGICAFKDGQGMYHVALYGVDNEPVSETEETYVVWRWKRDVLPSIFMPYAYCRLQRRILRCWPERLGEISEEDAIAEGVEPCITTWTNYLWHGRDAPEKLVDSWEHQYSDYPTAALSFTSLWARTYGTYDPDLWVWCYEWEGTDG